MRFKTRLQSAGTWQYENGADVLRIGGGLIDVGLGIGTIVGSWGWATIPGVGLMAVGIDQILTGYYNISRGVRAPSFFEYGGYWAAQGVGFSENTAQTIGAWTPAALSLGLAGWGWMASTLRFYRGTVYFDALETVGNQAINAERLAFFQLGRNYDLGRGLYMSRARATAANFAEWLSGHGGGPGLLRMEISRFRWWMMRLGHGAIDNVPISALAGHFQSFVPLRSINYFHRFARFFLE